MFRVPRARAGLLLVSLAMGAAASAQSFVTPTTNTNIIGQTPNPANIRDLGLKQQQEPSCIIRPSNESFIFCAYNDLRAADLPAVQGDSWMGVSMSNDAGQTWFSRLSPGYLGHANSLGMGFAADPGVVAIPGADNGGAGFAVLNYIAAFRDSNAGVLAIQRWVERPVEDQDFWKAEDEIYIVADGSEGRFIDKPAFLYLVDEPGQQGVINEAVAVEGEGSPVTVRTPTGTLIVVYAVFTGNGGGAKLLMRKSFDNGKTWTGSSKISEEQNEVTGVSLTAVGQNFVAVYRRKGDNNEPDAVMTALCANDGNQKCTKGQAIFQICPFDQPASGSTFRTFSFPWAASDGNRFWAIAADRRYPDNSCTPVPNAPGLFSGKPRIVAMSSVDGKNWVGGTADKAQPIVVAARADGFQMMPVARGTKGRIDIAWYDTFREEDIGLPPGPNDLLVNDYVANDNVSRVFRKADVFMTRLKASCGGGPTQGCDPVVEQPVRVSNYKFAVDLADPTVGAEIEAHLPNLTLYGSGLLAFNGDYIALATPELRKLASGKWISNSKPGGSNELPGFTNRQDLFIAWGDNRDVRADFPALDSDVQLPYTPPLNSEASIALLELEKDGELAFERPGELVAADEPDDNPVQPSDIGVCQAGFDFSRSRDSNVYGSLVRDEPSLVAPTATKPLGTIQRMFPLILTNIDADNGKDFCLQIANQPLDYPASAGAEGNGLASFYQLPSFAPFSNGDEVDLLDVFVPAGSSASRAVFVTTNNGQSVVTVNAFEGACPVTPAGAFGPLVNSVQISDGSLFDPIFCQQNPSDPVCEDVSASETHNISFAAPVLQTAVLQAPSFQTPSFQTPVLQTPVLQTPSFQTPSFQTPSFQTPSFQTPSFQTPSFQTPSFQTPVLQTPSFQTPSLQSNSFGDTATTNPEQVVYQDVTYPVSADANVTTTYSADIALTGLDPDETAVQLVAWTPNAYASTLDCYTQPTSDQQIIAYTDLDAPSLQSVTLPSTFSATNQNPYAGALSFFGQPGKDLAVTVRIWAVGQAKQDLIDLQADYQSCIDEGGGEECESLGVRQLISFGASAHSCQTGDAANNTEFPGSDDCLNNGNEKILEDKQPPTFNVDPNETITVEADLPGGALVDLAAGTVTASDNGEPVGVMCYEVAPDGTQTPLPELLDIGRYAILCEAGDSAGNLGSVELTLDVTDTVPPVLELSGDTSPNVEAGTPYVDPGYTATDLRGTTVITLLAVVTGSVDTSTLGVYTLTYTVTDTGGNTVEKTRTVTVSDTIAPILSGVPADISGIEATGSGGASVSWPAPTANDSFEGSLPVTCSPASGTIFAVGSTAVSCSASDSSGNTTSQSFLVTVVDTVPPIISAPTADVIEEATGPNGAVVTWSASAIDAADPLATVACVPASGSTFAIGTTGVVCTATDTSGNSSAASFNVIVQDTTAPAFGPLDDVAAEATGPAGAVVSFGPFAGTDAVDGAVTAVCTPASSSPFALGATAVSCTATDAAGNAATAGFNVTVADTTAPVLTAANIDIEALTAAVNLEIDYTDGVSVVDLVDAPGTIMPVCSVADPGPNATDNGTTLLVTAYGTWVASCTATDAAGNTSAPTLFNITVGFPWDIAIAVPKGNIRAGSTVPLDWTYSQNGQPVDSGALAPAIEWFGPYTNSTCTNGNSSAGNGEDAGGSDFRYTSPTWQYSWQTPSLSGYYDLVISPPGAADANATECVRLR